MSNNPGEAATTAREQETEQTQTPGAEQGAQSTSFEQQTGNVPAPSAERQAGLAQPAGTQAVEHAPEPRAFNPAWPEPTGAEPSQTHPAPSSGTPSPVRSSASPAPVQPTGEPNEGVANSANVEATTSAQEATRKEFAPRPDVSDQGFQELLPKLLAHFNNNREQLARAVGLHRSTVDRWLNGKSRPNTSTILRMRRLAQERNIE